MMSEWPEEVALLVSFVRGSPASDAIGLTERHGGLVLLRTGGLLLLEAGGIELGGSAALRAPPTAESMGCNRHGRDVPDAPEHPWAEEHALRGLWRARAVGEAPYAGPGLTWRPG